MSDIIPPDQRQLVEEHVAKLLEQFDSVRIFVTRHDGNDSNTASFEAGGGNFYAQLGQVDEWMNVQRQFQRNWADRNDSPPE